MNNKPKLKIDSNGTKRWLLPNGEPHREDGPAVEFADGSKCWCRNGKIHREDGPAVEYANGSKFWYRNGKVHREDGPAVEWPDGSKQWYLNGTQYTEEEWMLHTLQHVDPKTRKAYKDILQEL